MMTSAQRCACGLALHYRSGAEQARIQALIERLGPTIEVRIENTTDTIKVPRHYIALHGLRAAELGELAARYGWEHT